MNFHFFAVASIGVSLGLMVGWMSYGNRKFEALDGQVSTNQIAPFCYAKHVSSNQIALFGYAKHVSSSHFALFRYVKQKIEQEV